MKGKADSNTVVFTGDTWIGLSAAFVLLNMGSKTFDFAGHKGM